MIWGFPGLKSASKHKILWCQCSSPKCWFSSFSFQLSTHASRNYPRICCSQQEQPELWMHPDPGPWTPGPKVHEPGSICFSFFGRPSHNVACGVYKPGVTTWQWSPAAPTLQPKWFLLFSETLMTWPAWSKSRILVVWADAIKSCPSKNATDSFVSCTDKPKVMS